MSDQNKVDTLNLCDEIVSAVENAKLLRDFKRTFIGNLLRQDVTVFFEGVALEVQF